MKAQTKLQSVSLRFAIVPKHTQNQTAKTGRLLFWEGGVVQAIKEISVNFPSSALKKCNRDHIGHT